MLIVRILGDQSNDEIVSLLGALDALGQVVRDVDTAYCAEAYNFTEGYYYLGEVDRPVFVMRSVEIDHVDVESGRGCATFRAIIGADNFATVLNWPSTY